MANNPKLTNAAATEEADAVVALLSNGYLRIYDGTQPATADTAIDTQVLLAELRFATPAAPGATNGVATFDTITADTDANATGTASWFRALGSDGSSKVFDGSVGTSGCDINLNSTAIQIHAQVSITSFTFTAQKG